MFRHDHVSNDHEAVAPAHLFHDLQEQIAILRHAQQWTSLVATGGDEVKISSAVIPMQFGGHRQGLS
jgi:hypothetical protein